MGRGRQKAKQTKVARELKYHNAPVDVTALQRELSGYTPPPAPPPTVDDDEDDPYAAYADYDDGDSDDSDDESSDYVSNRR